MIYEEPTSKPSRRPSKRRKIASADPPGIHVVQMMKQRDKQLLIQEDQMSASDLPGDFPPELAYRALAAYSLLRTLSLQLRLSPFTPNVFLRALYLPYPNKILGQVHVSLLRVLLPHLQLGYTYKANGGHMHKRRTVDNLRWPLLAGDNLTYLDSLSWPLFFDDYCHLTADRLYASYNDPELHLDFRNAGMQPVGLGDYEYDYAAFDDEDDDEDAEFQNLVNQTGQQVMEDHDLNFLKSSSLSSMYPSGLLLRQNVELKQSMAGTVSLERDQRVGRSNRGYEELGNSDSDSEYGDKVDDTDDDAAAWVPKGRRKAMARKRKARKQKRKLEGKETSPSRSDPITLPRKQINKRDVALKPESDTKSKVSTQISPKKFKAGDEVKLKSTTDSSSVLAAQPTPKKFNSPLKSPTLPYDSKVMEVEISMRPSLDLTTPTSVVEHTSTPLVIRSDATAETYRERRGESKMGSPIEKPKKGFKVQQRKIEERIEAISAIKPLSNADDQDVSDTSLTTKTGVKDALGSNKSIAVATTTKVEDLSTPDAVEFSFSSANQNLVDGKFISTETSKQPETEKKIDRGIEEKSKRINKIPGAKALQTSSSLNHSSGNKHPLPLPNKSKLASTSESASTSGTNKTRIKPRLPISSKRAVDGSHLNRSQSNVQPQQEHQILQMALQFQSQHKQRGVGLPLEHKDFVGSAVPQLVGSGMMREIGRAHV